MHISISIQSFLFEKRLCWMLSSILQQRGMKPDIEIDVACVKNSGEPKCTDVLGFFRKHGLNIKSRVYPTMKEIQYRGWTRNHQLRDTDADWIMFVDSDMVYPPNFFSEMKTLLEGGFKDNPHCLHSRRQSTFFEETEKLIDKFSYPCIIPNVYELASKLAHKLKSNVGAGYFHLANVSNLKNNFGGLYCNPRRIRDKSWETSYPRARSDVAFKSKLGRQKIPLPIQIHLQHTRGSVEGKGKMLYNQK